MDGDPMKVAGIGCRNDTPLEALIQAVAKVDADILAGIGIRAHLLEQLAQALDLPLQIVEIAGIETPSQSPRIQALHATGSVAEAAALVAAGPTAKLTHQRIVSECGRITIAIAEVS
jgi:cobalt-precorrin 5A hydrolase